jgi:hypothetical protein
MVISALVKAGNLPLLVMVLISVSGYYYLQGKYTGTFTFLLYRNGIDGK